MKSCCGDKPAPEKSDDVVKFESTKADGCCGPASTTCGSGSPNELAPGGCCSSQTSGSINESIKEARCCASIWVTPSSSAEDGAPSSAVSEPQPHGTAAVTSFFVDADHIPSTLDNSSVKTAPQTEGALKMASRSDTFLIAEMCCPSEQTMIETKLGKTGGIKKLEFNTIKRTITVLHDLPDTSVIEAAVRSLGMRAEPLVASEATPGQTISSAQQEPPPRPKSRWWPLVVAGALATLAEVLHFTQSAPVWVIASVALLAIALCGTSTYKKGWISIKHLNLNINALMSIAVTGALLIGQWPEAAMVMFLFTLAEMVEAKSLDRARNAIKELMDLSPERATVRQPDNSWLEVDVKTVGLGDLVRVRPGERIGLDGDILLGNSSVNQAPITGESLPIEKTVGDPVYAGSINESGSFEFRVTAQALNTTLARIIHAVEEAQNSRAPTQRFVDQFARIYTPAVFLFALAIAAIPPFLVGGLWTDWIYRALVLLVVACPCALVISTPVSIVSGLAAAARRGILIKGGVYLEIGAKLDFIALDKTGTITHGKPVQTDCVVLLETPVATPQVIAASLAARSDHPVSKAIAQNSSNTVALQSIDGFHALAGRGVKGLVEGHLYHLGNLRLMEELGFSTLELNERVSTLERSGKTVVALASLEGVHALFAVADTMKPSSKAAISELHDLGIQTMMLSGDNTHTAKAIAGQVGIGEALGNLLPADKLTAIGHAQKLGHVVGMVGDGINDAPALAKSQIGFAMAAAGTGTAIETADVALMDDDLRKIPAFLRLSRNTAAVLKQNIVFALAIKAIFLVFTLMGVATMWMAVFADVGVSLLVVLNGLRLLRK